MSKVMERLRALAGAKPRRIVFPEPHDPRVVRAAAELAAARLVIPILLAPRSRLERAEHQTRLPDDGWEALDPDALPELDDYIQTYYQMRRHKGITLDDAASAMKNPLAIGAMMVRKGAADGMVAGSASPTTRVVRACLQIIGPAEGVRTVSSFFLITLEGSPYVPGGCLVFADGGLVPDPTAKQLAEIAVSSARSFQLLTGQVPRVAMLSYSTRGSASGPLVEKVVQATRLAREHAPEFILDGELQADAALVPDVAAIKCPDSPLEGKANVARFSRAWLGQRTTFPEVARRRISSRSPRLLRFRLPSARENHSGRTRTPWASCDASDATRFVGHPHWSPSSLWELWPQAALR